MKPTIISIIIILVLGLTFELLHRDDDKLAKQEVTQYCEILSNGQYHVWEEILEPTWCLNIDYRIKPEHKDDVINYLGVDNYGSENGQCCEDFETVDHWDNQIKLTFCGDTGKLKSAEALK